MRNEPLGTDYAAAVQRAENDPAARVRCVAEGRHRSASTSAVAAAGTLDWLFAEYRADRRYTKLDPKTRRNHENGFKLVGGHILKDGRRLGQARVTAITTAITDALYEALLPVKDAEGNVIGERRTTVNHAMKSCRRAWNIVARRHPGKLPHVNPFAQMGLRSSERETPTATYEELQAFRAKAVEMGLPSLATAALIGWEWLQREVDIFATFSVAHYRPKDRPDMVRVIHHKTREENYVPLFKDGVPLYPELMAELDAIKRERIGGLMLCRDWGDRCAVADMAEAGSAGLHPRQPQGEGSDPRRWPARRTVVHIVPPRRLHRDRRCRTDGSRDHGAGAAQVGQGAAEVRQAHHRSGRDRRTEAAGVANKKLIRVQNERQH